MGLFNQIKTKVTTLTIGELITDLGTLPVDDHGRELSVSIRQRPGKPPHLQMKLASTTEANYFQIPCSPQWADQFEKISQEIRKQLSTRQAA